MMGGTKLPHTPSCESVSELRDVLCRRWWRVGSYGQRDARVHVCTRIGSHTGRCECYCGRLRRGPTRGPLPPSRPGVTLELW